MIINHLYIDRLSELNYFIPSGYDDIFSLYTPETIYLYSYGKSIYVLSNNTLGFKINRESFLFGHFDTSELVPIKPYAHFKFTATNVMGYLSYNSVKGERI